MLIDENKAPGGHLRWTVALQNNLPPDLPDGVRGFELALWAAAKLAEAGVEVLSSTVAWGLFEDNTLGVTSASSSFQLRADSIVIASGSTDIVWPFPGWELPGVLTATAALRLLHLDRVLPGQRVAVIGDGDLATTVVADLQGCGASAVEQIRSIDGLTAGGVGRVNWIESDGQRTSVDTIVIALGRQPDAQLAHQAQVASAYSATDGVFVPVRDESFRTSDPGIFVIGDAGGVCSTARAFAEGVVAGEAATQGSGLSEARARVQSIEPGAVTPALTVPIADGTIVCRCEEVRAETMRAAIADGAVTINDLKRRTRGGMGICQGVYCNRTMATLISQEAGLQPGTIVPMTARPPARMIPMAAMADLEP